MNAKQQRFINEYLKEPNATKAAEIAGYTHPNIQGPRLLSNVSIRREIDAVLLKESEEAGVTVKKIVKEAALIAFSDLSNFLKDCENIKNPSDWPEEVRRGIQSFKITRTSKGEEETTRTEIKLWDKTAMLEFLGRYLGMLKDKGDQSQVIIQAPDFKRAEPNG